VKDDALTEEERACFGKLKAYVESFTPEPCLTKEDLPLLDADGQPMFEARLINTKVVLRAPSRAARKELLGKIECFPFSLLPVYNLSLFWVFFPVFVLWLLTRCYSFADNMADFAKDFLKHAADQQKAKKGRKGVITRAAMSAAVGRSGSAASTGSPAEKKVASPVFVSSSARGPKRQRGPDEVVDVDVEVGFMLPQCHEMGCFLDNCPLRVPASDKKIITGMTVENRGEGLARDTAGLIRILETALTLNEAAGKSAKEVQELKEEKASLETKVLGLENRVDDLLGKQENFAKVQAELRDKETELEQLRKEVGERDKLEEEVSRLKAAMAPAVDEPDTTRDLSSRAELVGEIRLLGGKLIDGAKFAFKNAVEQM
jgi:hypothetical protein